MLKKIEYIKDIAIMPNTTYLLGGYTKKNNYGLWILHQDGSLQKSLDIKNCTYFCEGEAPFLFVLTEKGIAVCKKILNEKGNIELILLQKLQVANQTGCHLYFRKKSQTLYVASYHDGRLQRYQFSKESESLSLIEEICFISSSIHKNQTSAHLHFVSASKDENTLFLCDLGGDCLYLCPLNVAGSLKTPPQKISLTTKGAGPRHLVFSPCETYLYLHCELNNSLLVYKKEAVEEALDEKNEPIPLNSTFIAENLVESPNYQLIQEIFILEEGEKLGSMIDKDLESAGAAIRITKDGRFLYTSTRFNNLISCFEIHKENGKVQCIQSIASGGLTPRDFNLSLDEKILLVAHQDSDELCFFERIEEGTKKGTLKALENKTSVPECTCILPL